MKRVRQRLLRGLLPPPVSARHVEYSLLLSADDDPGQPSDRLLDVASQAASSARRIQLTEIAARAAEGSDTRYVQVWPGEHYRLLAGLVEVLDPELVVEIGTHTGLSALALKGQLSARGRIVTFDVLAWETLEGTALRETDFADGRLAQIVDDVSDLETAHRYRDLFAQADLIFIDAAKDGSMEARLLDTLELFQLTREPIVVFDDIRLWNMLAIWRGISRPKLDLTSLGHWSGTGLVEWTKSQSM